MISQIQRRAIYVEKTRAELGDLARRGVRMGGNAFSSVVAAKGELSPEERAGAALLSGADGVALRRALTTLGYAPENWAALSTVGDDGRPLSHSLVRTAVAALDPATLIILDNAAAYVIRDTYKEELAALSAQGLSDEAALSAGVIAPVLGMRVMNLGGFADALADPRRKQWMWACLKRLPPLGEPY